jgi:hypothetical protein
VKGNYPTPGKFLACSMYSRGLYIGKYSPPPGGVGEYQPMSFGGKNMKRAREKSGKCKRKRKKM